MNSKLQNKRARDIWEVLVSHSRNREPITYKDLAAEIDVFHMVLTHPLELIQDYCEKKSLPGLSGIVISSISGMPGSGSNIYGKSTEIEFPKVFNFDWSKVENPFDNLDADEAQVWWANESRQSFWMESRKRNLGDNLHAPVTSNAGHKLVDSVESGDIILHYYQPKNAIVGFSIAVGHPFESKITWPLNSKKLSPAYEVKLIKYTELDNPITLKDFQDKGKEIREVKERLTVKFRGSAVYYPFQIRKSDIRPAQGMYLSKFPVEILEELFFDRFQQILDDTPEEMASLPRKVQRTDTDHRNGSQTGGQGRQTDVRKKIATELYAMKCAEKYLSDLGYEVKDKSKRLSLGYDLEARKGGEIIGVEVKGSLGINRISVDLQSSEVSFAQNHSESYRTLLYVVDGIELKEEAGQLIGVSGRERAAWDWSPLDEFLRPINFRFELPEMKEIKRK